MSISHARLPALALGLCALTSLPAAAGEAEERAAAEVLERRMQNENPEDLKLLRAVKGREIVVVQGSMDHIEQVLAAAKIRHTLIRPDQVAGWDLTADHILMVNCPGKMPQAGIRRIERFVRAGGLLYTTDWALLNVVQKAFPKTIAHNGRSTGDHVTAVTALHKHNNMMTGVMLRDASRPQWWLEGGSYPVKVLDPRRVQVLAESAEMKAKYGSAPVVTRFRWEDGEVIHVVSHFYRQVQTRGPQVATKNALSELDGLTDADKEALAAQPAADVPVSGLESSYAFQRMTSNLVVGKKRANKQLDKQYKWTPKKNLKLQGTEVGNGRRIKVLEKKGAKVKVRDDRGNEDWVFEDALIMR